MFDYMNNTTLEEFLRHFEAYFLDFPLQWTQLPFELQSLFEVNLTVAIAMLLIALSVIFRSAKFLAHPIHQCFCILQPSNGKPEEELMRIWSDNRYLAAELMIASGIGIIVKWVSNVNLYPGTMSAIAGIFAFILFVVLAILAVLHIIIFICVLFKMARKLNLESSCGGLLFLGVSVAGLKLLFDTFMLVGLWISP